MIGKIASGLKKLVLEGESTETKEKPLEVKSETKILEIKTINAEKQVKKEPITIQNESSITERSFNSSEDNNVIGLLDFQKMAYVLGITNIADYTKEYYENLETWYEKSYNVFLALERELVNTLSDLQTTTVGKDSGDIPTLAKDYLTKVAEFKNNMDNFSELEKFRNEARSFTKLSTLCDNLGIYSRHMKSYVLLQKALASLNYFYAELMRERKREALLELETVKHYAIENEQLKNKQTKILLALNSLKSKYSDSLNELSKLEVEFNGEVKNDSSKSPELPKIGKLPNRP